MTQTILQTLFLDNPEIPKKIAKFCDNLPECSEQAGLANPDLLRMLAARTQSSVSLAAASSFAKGGFFVCGRGSVYVRAIAAFR